MWDAGACAVALAGASPLAKCQLPAKKMGIFGSVDSTDATRAAAGKKKNTKLNPSKAGGTPTYQHEIFFKNCKKHF